jgi:hypothetical protein
MAVQREREIERERERGREGGGVRVTDILVSHPKIPLNDLWGLTIDLGQILTKFPCIP